MCWHRGMIRLPVFYLMWHDVFFLSSDVVWCDLMSFHFMWCFLLFNMLWGVLIWLHVTNSVWLWASWRTLGWRRHWWEHVIHPVWPLTLRCCSAQGRAARGRRCVMCTVRLRRVAWFLRTSALRRKSRWPSTPVGRETVLHTGWAKTGRGWGLHTDSNI